MPTGPLFKTVDDRFPIYFRLFWSEVEEIIFEDKKFLSQLAGVLENATYSDWFAYALDVFENPRAMLKIDNSVLQKGDRRRRIVDNDEEIIREKAEMLRTKTKSTFIYEAMHNNESIKLIDEYIRQNYPNLWQAIHLCGVSPDQEAVRVYLKYFFPTNRSDLLDHLSVAFKNLDGILELEKYLGNVLCKDKDKSIDYCIRFFLRRLPHCNNFDEDLFIDIIAAMVKGGHIAALTILLPDWYLVYQQKKEEKDRLRNKNLDIQEENDIFVEEILSMRPPKEYFERSNLGMEGPLQTLHLRDYQEELVEYACKGKNTIVVAPTGAGKTAVAVHVAQWHINKREEDGKPSRVVMLVPKIPLVDQQQDRFRDYLGHKFTINGIHGGMNLIGENRTSKFLSSDIIVMTPQILYDLMRSVKKKERIYLADISLIIFDEVHHCQQEHVYNTIMQYIHDYPRQELQPQILGLTATPLPTKQTDVENAMEAIYRLMANASCDHLSTVVRHVESLERQVPKPDEVSYQADPSRPNAFMNIVKIIIGNILREIQESLRAFVTSGKASGYVITKKDTELHCSTPFKFNNQLNLLRDKLTKNSRSGTEKTQIFVALDYLFALTKSLMINELLPCNFAIEFLDSEMTKAKNRHSNKSATDLYKFYDNEVRSLGDLDNNVRKNWRTDEKPVVNILIKEIISNFRENADTRCIIFVQERAMARRLMTFLNNIHILNANNLVAFVTSTKGTGADSMSPEDQRKVLQQFNDGEVKIIVATSVLDEGIDVSACNLIIKYNASSSAVAKIQRAGRVRMKGGKSIFICLHDGIASSEYEASWTGNIMKHCVRTLQSGGPSQIRANVRRCKERLKLERDTKKKEKEENEQRLKGNQFNIICKDCGNVICDSDSVKLDGSYCCIVDKDIWRKFCIRIVGDRSTDSQHQMVGELYCIGSMDIDELGEYWKMDTIPELKCGHRVGSVCKIVDTYFPVLTASKVYFRQTNNTFNLGSDITDYNKWVKVSNELFFIPELRESDLKRMLHAMDGRNTPECQKYMKAKLDAASVRISAEFSREAMRKQTEKERRERILNALTAKVKDDNTDEFQQNDPKIYSSSSSSDDEED